MIRVIILVAILLAIVYILRSIMVRSLPERRETRRPPADGRTIEGEPPRVRDAENEEPR